MLREQFFDLRNQCVLHSPVVFGDQVPAGGLGLYVLDAVEPFDDNLEAKSKFSLGFIKPSR